MQSDDLSAIRLRIPAGEHLTAEEWLLLMEHVSFAHQIADLTLEYLAAFSNRKLHEQRCTRKDSTILIASAFEDRIKRSTDYTDGAS